MTSQELSNQEQDQTQARKVQAVADFLEYSAFSSVDSHSHHDGAACKGHAEVFQQKAEELLAVLADFEQSPVLTAVFEREDFIKKLRTLTYTEVTLISGLANGELGNRNAAARAAADDDGWD